MNKRNIPSVCAVSYKAPRCWRCAKAIKRLVPDHLLKVLLDDSEGLAAMIASAGGDSPRCIARSRQSRKQPKVEGQGAGQI